MRVGTIAVRAELPTTASHITDKQIQEALWHYYYDIEKSVGYLVNTYVAKPKKEKKVKGGLISFLGAERGPAGMCFCVIGGKEKGNAGCGGGLIFVVVENAQSID